MASEVVFNSFKSALSIMGAFFAEVSKEVGEDKALELYARQGTAMGAMLAQVVKKHADHPDALSLIREELESLYESFGVSAEFEQDNGTLIASVSRCPFYEGFSEAGLEPQIIHKMCRAMSDQESAKFKELLPESDLTLAEFRTSGDGCCKEEYKLGL